MIAVAFACFTRPEFHQTVVGFNQRNQSHEAVQFLAATEMRRFKANRAQQQVDPFPRRQLPSRYLVLFEIKRRNLDRFQTIDPERAALALLLLVVLVNGSVQPGSKPPPVAGGRRCSRCRCSRRKTDILCPYPADCPSCVWTWEYPDRRLFEMRVT